MASFDFAQAASRHHSGDTGGDAHMRVVHQVDVTEVRSAIRHSPRKGWFDDRLILTGSSGVSQVSLGTLSPDGHDAVFLTQCSGKYATFIVNGSTGTQWTLTDRCEALSRLALTKQVVAAMDRITAASLPINEMIQGI